MQPHSLAHTQLRLLLYAEGQVYDGMFGKWSVDSADQFEVWSYRVGLTATVAGESAWGERKHHRKEEGCVCGGGWVEGGCRIHTSNYVQH